MPCRNWAVGWLHCWQGGEAKHRAGAGAGAGAGAVRRIRTSLRMASDLRGVHARSLVRTGPVRGTARDQRHDDERSTGLLVRTSFSVFPVTRLHGHPLGYRDRQRDQSPRRRDGFRQQRPGSDVLRDRCHTTRRCRDCAGKIRGRTASQCVEGVSMMPERMATLLRPASGYFRAADTVGHVAPMSAPFEPE